MALSRVASRRLPLRCCRLDHPLSSDVTRSTSLSKIRTSGRWRQRESSCLTRRREAGRWAGGRPPCRMSSARLLKSPAWPNLCLPPRRWQGLSERGNWTFSVDRPFTPSSWLTLLDLRRSTVPLSDEVRTLDIELQEVFRRFPTTFITQQVGSAMSPRCWDDGGHRLLRIRSEVAASLREERCLNFFIRHAGSASLCPREGRHGEASERGACAAAQQSELGMRRDEHARI